jgi:hypothetical protein
MNERHLLELQATATDKEPMRAESNLRVATRSTVDEVAMESKKPRQRQTKGKKNKQDETQLQQKPQEDNVATQVSAAMIQQQVITPVVAAVDDDDEVAVLHRIVLTQQQEISKLQLKLNSILSFLGIDDTVIGNADYVNEQGNNDDFRTADETCLIPLPADRTDTANTDKTYPGGDLWSDVVSKRHWHQKVDTFQQSVITAVYVDQTVKKRRETSLIVTGLVPTEHISDTKLFADLCNSEFHVQPEVVYTKRLGHPQSGKTQPLLIYLKQADQVTTLINCAKNLRRSTDPAIREKVYINSNLTKAEAAAAYQVRLRRRLAHQRRNEGNDQDQQSSADQDRQRNNNVASTTDPATSSGLPLLNPMAGAFMPLASEQPTASD